jgi:hypothetical protein
MNIKWADNNPFGNLNKAKDILDYDSISKIIPISRAQAEQEYFEKRILECIKLHSQSMSYSYNDCLDYWASFVLSKINKGV